MFSITVSYGNAMAQLLFKTEDAAKVAWVEICRSAFAISDDFGRQVVVLDGYCTGAIFEDLDKSKEGQIQAALHQARTQAEAQKRGANDPALRSMSQQLHSPAMLSPMGNGRF